MTTITTDKNAKSMQFLYQYNDIIICNNEYIIIIQLSQGLSSNLVYHRDNCICAYKNTCKYG